MTVKFILLLILAINLPLTVNSCFARTQSIAVRGHLLCYGHPATSTRVRLYDSDSVDQDDLLDQGVVDRNGLFYLAGSTKELTTIDPMLSIFHDCNDRAACQKRVDIMIPQSPWVTSGKYPQYVYELGTLNLDANFDGQTRDCLD